jgi:hypothetical protein
MTTACVVAVVGCQRSPYELAPVSGTVTIDGRPVSQSTIMFYPTEHGDNANPGKPAFGLLNENGTYTLSTYETNDGAVVGEHWVTLINVARDSEAHGNQPRSPGAPSFARLTVPRRVTVLPHQENQIDIKLSRQDVAQYGTGNND